MVYYKKTTSLLFELHNPYANEDVIPAWQADLQDLNQIKECENNPMALKTKISSACTYGATHLAFYGSHECALGGETPLLFFPLLLDDDGTVVLPLEFIM